MQDPCVVGKKFGSFPSNFFKQPFQYFQIVNLVDCLSSWYKFFCPVLPGQAHGCELANFIDGPSRNEVDMTNTSSKIFVLNTDLNFKSTFKNTPTDESLFQSLFSNSSYVTPLSSHKGRKIVHRLEILSKLI